MFPIPKSFKVFGRTINVVMRDDLLDADEALGMTYPSRSLIELQKPCSRVSETEVEQTFFHELSHLLMHVMGEEEKYEDEKFVDLLGSLLHQIVTQLPLKTAPSRKR